jgi:hypothetical protein
MHNLPAAMLDTVGRRGAVVGLRPNEASRSGGRMPITTTTIVTKDKISASLQRLIVTLAPSVVLSLVIGVNRRGCQLSLHGRRRLAHLLWCQLSITSSYDVPGGSAVSKRSPLQPSPSPVRLRRPIQTSVPPEGVRASW